MEQAYSKIPEFKEFEKSNDWDFGTELLKRYNNDFYFHSEDEGFYCAYSKSPNNYHIWLLGIFPEHRGNGFGKKLINNFISRAIEKNYKILTVKSYNPIMIRCLVSCGFRFIGNDVFQLKI
jgi:ribosomal protein S18 acetylase RimI-like enzyme